MREVVERVGVDATGEEDDQVARHAIERGVQLGLEQVGEHDEEREAGDERGVDHHIIEDGLFG